MNPDGTIPVLEVNTARFAELFPPRVRRATTMKVWELLDGREGLNEEFFGRMHSYHKQPFYEPHLSYPDLFSPNICAIDFALDHLSRENDVILDWGCGLGTCGQYLTQLGFRVYGYDNWAQVPRELADRFQARFDKPLPFVESFNDVEPTVVMFVSCWCLDRGAWDRQCVKWILGDTHYAENSFNAKRPRGFDKFAQYDANYLTVFRRKE